MICYSGPRGPTQQVRMQVGRQTSAKEVRMLSCDAKRLKLALLHVS